MQTTETIGRAVGDGTRCRGHREIRPGGRRANLLVQMPFPRPIAAPDGAPDGIQGTDHGRRADGQEDEGGGDRRDGGLPCGFRHPDGAGQGRASGSGAIAPGGGKGRPRLAVLLLSLVERGHLENRAGHRKKTMRAAISHVIATRKGPLATLRTTLVRNLTRRSAHQHHPLPRPCGLRPVTLAGRSTRMWRLSVDAKAPPEDRDVAGFVCSAYARPTAGSEQLTWTRCSKTRSNSLTTSL